MEFTPLEMASAYATIANDGIYIEPTFYSSIVDSRGRTVMTSKQEKRTVFSEQVAYVLKKLLQQPVMELMVRPHIVQFRV